MTAPAPSTGPEVSSISRWMHLKILLPHQVFADLPRVLRIVAESRSGSFGILPRRLDCMAALAPGILLYETPEAGEVFVAVNEGILVKTGTEVLISVRNAISGGDLGRLQAKVEEDFLNLDERERAVRSVLAQLESQFIRRLMGRRYE